MNTFTDCTFTTSGDGIRVADFDGADLRMTDCRVVACISDSLNMARFTVRVDSDEQPASDEQDGGAPCS